jgi:glycosyltransferase involved in cell wall biosynthesis
MKKRIVIALLGKPDSPTDAIEQYCKYLGRSLKFYGISLDIRRVPWYSLGWSKSLRTVHSELQTFPKDTSFLLQYTALSWSRRGFPFQFLRLLKTLRRLNHATDVVFHDVEPYGGTRRIDRVRRKAQIYIMRAIVSGSSRAFFTVPLDRVTWMDSAPPNAHFIPVGPNLPLAEPPFKNNSETPTIAVFGVTGGAAGFREIEAIAASLRYVSQRMGALHLRIFGRNVDLFEVPLRDSLRDIPVQISLQDVIDSTQLVQNFCAADVLLFVRGSISSRRGSAIAGIACGLPVIAFAGCETGRPITDAGVLLAPENDQDGLNRSLLRILLDQDLRNELAARSRSAFLEHFSWNTIAAQFSSLLGQ